VRGLDLMALVDVCERGSRARGDIEGWNTMWMKHDSVVCLVYAGLEHGARNGKARCTTQIHSSLGNGVLHTKKG
jgi:hypothetical protein